ncbi:MAG: acyl-CoA dehydrogenase [Acidiferrobacteraceae bacterium]|nr:acyl-CoA dehydrogenase [Acidiferrobacteraceae bacterium]
MQNYRPPIEDIAFVLTDLAHLSGVCALPGHEDITPELVATILEQAGKFASEVLAPLNHVGDVEGSHLVDGIVSTPTGWQNAYREFSQNGWTGLLFDSQYGGQGLPRLVGVAVQELWDASNMAFSLCPMLTQTAAEVICLQGTAEQKKIYLEPLVSGKWTGTMNLTEPQAGSDLSGIRTQAVRTPEGHYKLSGQKIFITYGDHDLAENIVHLVLARTPDAPSGVKGISLFIVPKFIPDSDGNPGKRNDVRTVSLEHKLGIRASPTAVLSYGDESGAIGHLLGEEHRGLEYMFIMMNMARHAVGIEAYAIADRAYQRALDYSMERVQGYSVGSKNTQKVPIRNHPDVSRMLVEMECQIQAMRALSLYTASAQDFVSRHPDDAKRADSQVIVDVLTPIVKGWSSEVANDIASQGIQVMGGMGFIEETGMAQYFRDARITTIYEGTTGIQAADLVRRKLISDRGAMIQKVIELIRRDIEDSNAKNAPEVLSINMGTMNGLELLQDSTAWLLDSERKDPRLPFAASFNYLMLWGIVAGGWQMMRASSIALKYIEEKHNTSFYSHKVLTSKYYAGFILPKTAGYYSAIVNGSELLMDAK